MSRLTSVSVTLVILASVYRLCGAQVNLDVDNDLTRPTLAAKDPTLPSIPTDDRKGLNLNGPIVNGPNVNGPIINGPNVNANLNDLLGPPIKIGNGQNYASISQTTNAGQQTPFRPAILGLDSNLLEMAGMPHLMKGGLLMGKAGAKVGGATLLAGIKGKKIASIIELPIKLIAMKELAIGSALTGMGRKKNQQQDNSINNYPEQQIQQEQIQQESYTGAGAPKNPLAGLSDKLVRKSQSLKQHGKQQMIQGTTESLNTFANHLQQTVNHAASGLKLLPLILDLPTGPNFNSPNNNSPLTNGVKASSNVQPGPTSSFSGSPMLQGLNTLVSPIGPIMSGIFDPASSNHYPPGGSNVKGGSQGFSNLHQNLGQTFNGLTGLLGSGGIGGFLGLGGSNPNPNGLAAVLDAANPLTNILMNLGPNARPSLFPLNIGSGFGGKPGGGKPNLFANLLSPQQGSTNSFSLIPGFKITETSHSNLPNLNLDFANTGANIAQQTYEQPRKTTAALAPQQAPTEQRPISQSASPPAGL